MVKQDSQKSHLQHVDHYNTHTYNQGLSSTKYSTQSPQLKVLSSNKWPNIRDSIYKNQQSKWHVWVTVIEFDQN